jgi:O-antigen/teichoic acid export membrane protein
VLTGVYNAAKRIIIAFNSMFSTALNSVVLHALAHVSDDQARSGRGFLRAVSITVLGTAPLYAGLAVLAPDLIHIALGEKWADAAPVLCILSVSGFVSSLAEHNSSVILVKQKPHWVLWLTGTNAVCNILAFALVGRMGLLWVAGAVAIRSLLLLPVSAACALKLFHLSFASYGRAVLPSATAAAAMAVFVWCLRRAIDFTPLSNAAILIPAGAAFYLALGF